MQVGGRSRILQRFCRICGDCVAAFHAFIGRRAMPTWRPSGGVRRRSHAAGSQHFPSRDQKRCRRLISAPVAGVRSWSSPCPNRQPGLPLEAPELLVNASVLAVHAMTARSRPTKPRCRFRLPRMVDGWPAGGASACPDLVSGLMIRTVSVRVPEPAPVTAPGGVVSSLVAGGFGRSHPLCQLPVGIPVGILLSGMPLQTGWRPAVSQFVW